jgi:hypothetical protein
MPSLSAHLRVPEDHSRLPFHPACPVCRRDRLAGSLDGEELVSRRTRATIAAGLLAFSTAGVPAAVAAEPDEVSEGAVEVVVDGDTGSSVDFEPGGETVQLPDEQAPVPVETAPAASDDDAGPLEVEPATDTVEPVVEATLDEVAEPVDDPAPVAPETAPAAPTAPVEAPAPVVAPVEGVEEIEPQLTQEQREPKSVGGNRREARADKPDATDPSEKRRSEPVVAEPVAAAEPAPATLPAAEPAPATTVRVVARSGSNRISAGDRVHVVRPGESLWSIATDLLGEGATVASVAREVNRLWELNDERIGTGQPDLLFTGTRLRLR